MDEAGSSDRHDEEQSEQGDTESIAGDDNTIKIKLSSPMGGRSIDFVMNRKGIKNVDVLNELKEHILAVFSIGFGIKEAFERAIDTNFDQLNHNDIPTMQRAVERLNKCINSICQLWKGATRPVINVSSFASPYCSPQELLLHCHRVFNRSVPDASVLNKHYEAFSSQVYGETSFEQMQLILDQLKLTDKDVFVDLGSGVGHLVVYVAGGSQVKKCVGIEIADTPAKYASAMKVEFEKMMSWYGKKIRPFKLEHGSFLDEKYRELITKEATVIFINNYAFQPDLEDSIKKMILEMSHGVRIITTKQYVQLREKGEDTNSRINQRRIGNGDLTAILDHEFLKTTEKPTSWTGQRVPYHLHTVNHMKIQQYYDNKKEKEDTKSVSVSSSPSMDSDAENNTLSNTIDEVAARRLVPKAYAFGEEEEDPYLAKTSALNRSWAGKGTKRFVKDEDDDEDYQERVPKKKSHSGRSGHKSPQKKKSSDKERSHASRSSSHRSLDDASIHSMMHNSIKESTKLKHKAPPAEDAAPARTRVVPADAVVLDRNDPLDRHMIELRQQIMDFMSFIATEEGKKHLRENCEMQMVRNQELQARVMHLGSTVEQLLNAGVACLNGRLQELEMSDVTCPADILSRSKKIVTMHNEITMQVSNMESEVLALERNIRAKVPYGSLLLEKLDTADCTGEDAYGVLISQACAETMAGEENEPLLMQGHPTAADHQLLSPTAGGAQPARRPRQRPRANPNRRSGGSGNASANMGAGGTGPTPKIDNEDIDRHVQEILKKCKDQDQQSKEKDRRPRASSDRKRSGGAGHAASASASAPTQPVAPSAAVHPMQNTAAGPFGNNLPDIIRQLAAQQQQQLAAAAASMEHLHRL